MIATLLGRTLIAATVLAGTALTSATASAERTPASFVNLTIQEDGGATRSASLTCEPAGGSHPRATEVCATLRAANGDFGALQPQNAQCPMIYTPVRVGAQGSWYGKSVNFNQSFPNACVAASKTDRVFDF